MGLQIGSMDQRVRRILVALDVTDQVLLEARRRRVDLLISHHPLFFHPLRSIDPGTRVGRLALQIVRSGMALYTMHTNLDFAESGVSFALAGALGLREVEFLEHEQRREKKIVVFVPPEHTERVMAAMSGAGAGKIGKYESCSFRLSGSGTFRPLEGAAPFAGRVGELATAQEVRLEMAVPEWRTGAVIAAMRSAHPYEEVAYDLYDLSNASASIGAGAIGVLRQAMPLGKFLARVGRSLKVQALRYAGKLSASVTRVAVCGGSGSHYIESAIRHAADAFVTADVSYHSFQEADGRLALIDAGHYETERPALQRVVDFLKSRGAAGTSGIQVFPSSVNGNFVQYY